MTDSSVPTYGVRPLLPTDKTVRLDFCLRLGEASPESPDWSSPARVRRLFRPTASDVACEFLQSESQVSGPLTRLKTIY